MTDQPFISIVIISYNTAHLVERAIASAQAQTFTDREIIVVDDGSTDDTEARLAHRADIRYLKIRNSGVGGARNAGIAVARGEWIALLDSDDEWLPDKLEKQALVARDPRFAGVSVIGADYNEVCDGRVVRERAMRSGFPIYTEWGLDLGEIFTRCERVGPVDGPACFDVYTGRDFRKVFHGNFILPSTALLRRAAAERYGVFKTHYRAGDEDTDLFLRWAWHTDLAIIDEPLVAYTVGRPGQQTSRAKLQKMVWTDAKLRRAFLREHPEFREQQRELIDTVFSVIYARLGRIQLFGGDVRRARVSLALARRYHALAGKNAVTRWLAWLPSGVIGAMLRLRASLRQRRQAGAPTP